MIYLYEKFVLKSATPKNLEEFIQFAEKDLIPFYGGCSGRVMFSWFSNGETLLEISQITEFSNLESFERLDYALFESEYMEEKFNLIVPKRERMLLKSPGKTFSDSFQKQIENSRVNPAEIYTLAVLDVKYDQMKGFVKMNESALSSGVPIVTSLVSVTGRQNRIINIWKTDLQKEGYKTQEYYDSIGWSEDWWKWIRSVAPKEKLIRACVLPYSPMR